MRAHCQPGQQKPTLGFFGTIGSIISACMRVIFGTVLPTVIALAIVFFILFLIAVIVMMIADSLGSSNFLAKYKQREREKEEEKRRMEAGEKARGDVEGLGLLRDGGGEGDVGLGGDGDREIIDVGDRKRRVEVEIEFLETLLRDKKEILRALQ
ncbi:hypothetical protein BJY00DRAFT_318077 [Aspergillus carlsbadensis]|nr:hypothetical protein BJY00DRAFT_318077 [Aspergillus carlsbadensis]